MFIQRFLGVGLALMVLAAGWRYREVWWGPSEPAPSAGATPVSGPPGVEVAASTPAPQGAPGPVAGARRSVAVAGGPVKCRKGKRIIYTEGACPEGTEELSIQGGTVNVIPPTPGAQGTDGAAHGGGKAERGGKVIASPLIAPYVQNDGPTIRQQAIERAVQQ